MPGRSHKDQFQVIQHVALVRGYHAQSISACWTFDLCWYR